MTPNDCQVPLQCLDFQHRAKLPLCARVVGGPEMEFYNGYCETHHIPWGRAERNVHIHVNNAIKSLETRGVRPADSGHFSASTCTLAVQASTKVYKPTWKQTVAELKATASRKQKGHGRGLVLYQNNMTHPLCVWDVYFGDVNWKDLAIEEFGVGKLRIEIGENETLETSLFRWFVHLEPVPDPTKPDPEDEDQVGGTFSSGKAKRKGPPPDLTLHILSLPPPHTGLHAALVARFGLGFCRDYQSQQGCLGSELFQNLCVSTCKFTFTSALAEGFPIHLAMVNAAKAASVMSGIRNRQVVLVGGVNCPPVVAYKYCTMSTSSWSRVDPEDLGLPPVHRSETNPGDPAEHTLPMSHVKEVWDGETAVVISDTRAGGSGGIATPDRWGAGRGRGGRGGC